MELEATVRTTIDRLAHQYGAFPTSIAKYLLEHAGVYQDIAGKTIKGIFKEGRLKERRVGKHSIFYDPTLGSKVPQNLKRATRHLKNFMNAVSNQNASGFMAELVFYAAFCKVYTELRNRIQIQIWPKGNYAPVYGIDWEADFQIVVGGENFPIDVSNSIQQTMEYYGKVKRAAQIHDKRLASPLLVNRMSSGRVKTQYFKWNSSVCDFGKLILLDDSTTRQAKSAAKELEVDKYVNWVPPLKLGGYVLAGRKYDRLMRKRVNGLPQLSVDEMAVASSQLPDEILKRVRGLVRLLWVNSYYRRAENSDERLLSLIVQWSYGYLLRGNRPASLETLLAYSEGRLRDPFLSIFSATRAKFQSAFEQKLGILAERKFLKIANATYEVPDALYPMIEFQYA